MTFDKSLHAAAAMSAGPAPTDDLGPWLARVASIYEALSSQQSSLAARLDLIARIEAPKEVRERGFGIAVGNLLSVDTEHGRGVLRVQSEFESQYGDGLDTFRTVWLTDGGTEIVEAARRLVGQRVRVWKYPEDHSKELGKTIRMAAKIEAAGPARTVEPEPVAAHASSNGQRSEDYDEPF